MEALSSELNYFEQPIRQTAVQEEFDQEISPIATIQAGAPIEFLIKGVKGEYLDLNNSKLEVRCKLTKEDGTNLLADNRVSVVNLMQHSLYSNIDMEIGGKQVTDQNNFYPFRAIFETILNYCGEVLETRMLWEGWNKDTSNKVDVTDSTGDNAGIATREFPYKQSKEVRLV